MGGTLGTDHFAAVSRALRGWVAANWRSEVTKSGTSERRKAANAVRDT
jgi:hypothetical protein